MPARFRCKKCGWVTADESQLVKTGSGCCGQQGQYKCRSCGYNMVYKIGGGPTRQKIVRITRGHGGTVARRGKS